MNRFVSLMGTVRACRLPHRLLPRRRRSRHSRENFQVTAARSWHSLVDTNQLLAMKGSWKRHARLPPHPDPHPIPQTICAPVNKRCITIKTTFYFTPISQ